MDDEKTVYNNDPASLDRNPVKDMRRFIDFQHRTLALKKSKTIDNAFDAMEELLIGVVDFSYVTLQYRDKAGNFTPLRQFCPESLPIDRSLMEWILKTQEVSVLPIESSIQGENLHSLVGLPFSNHHLMLLWLEEEVSAFTQEQEALLTILTREMAAVLDTHYYRISLEKANAALADVIGSIPIGLISLGPENDIRIVNPIAEKWLGIDSARAIGNDFHQFLPQLLVSLIERLSAGNSSEEAEYANSEAMPELKEEGVGGDKREGQTLGITVCPMRCVDTAEKTGKIVVCRDLGLSREVEKLRELDAMKDDFLSLITHELRTPLTSIMAYSEAMMLDETVENIPREWQEYIGVINSEGKRLCHLIDDTLDITRMRSGKMCYTFSEEDPNEIVGSAIMTYNSEIESKRLHLDLNLDEEIGQCRLIPERFLQAVKILVSNAVRYTNPDGRITISTKREAPSSGSDFPTLLLTVRDTGIGIAPENFERIFGDFEILEKVKHHTTGMGLSLAVCKQIIENGHKGSIWVESELNKGSSFFVRIPIK